MLFNGEPAGSPSEEASANEKREADKGGDELGNTGFHIDFAGARIGEENAHSSDLLNAASVHHNHTVASLSHHS